MMQRMGGELFVNSGGLTAIDLKESRQLDLLAVLPDLLAVPGYLLAVLPHLLAVCI
ncbi:hypothetical protein RCG24_14300 [Neobacillus sp. OS1-32]|jgi:hypothetical protein|uniref:Uncharacterized protein n=1 Tax=Neobacillus paridis TaxID=2803862 RepID=A0ABS1TU64_9BACI|nr:MULTISPECIES: hypothetical protein [Neobacillus]MBL4954269.1 hypothetical protein [Neobacillus paridis]WML29160.1 hypothetical protein RCG24_14300 [Neobacillus sp. OS1-32]